MVEDDQVNFSGRFWAADNPELVVAGRLDISGRRPHVELLGSLSPLSVEEPSEAEGVRAFAPAERPGPRTLHGVLLGQVLRVTVVNAHQVRHTTKSMFVLSTLPNEGLEEEIFEGDYVILGAHVRGDEATFSAFRFRLAFQDAWAHLSGLTMTLADGADATERKVTIEHVLPDAVTAPLAGLSGSLSLEAMAAISPPRIAGAYVRTRTWLKVELNQGVPVRAAWRRFVQATSALLTMLHDKECSPTAFEVYVSDSDRWCTVRLPGLVPDPTDLMSPKLPDPALLNRQQLGLERLAAWFDLAHRLSPLPHLVAGAVQPAERAVQNLLLELAVAAEGLHRRLYPDARKLNTEERAEALAAITNLELSAAARQALHDAMRLYLWEPSFPQRLRRLAEDVGTAMPGVTGKTSKWVAGIRDARNGFAHSLHGTGADTDSILGYNALQLSLRWLLMGRMLLELGIPVTELSQAASDFRRYENFLYITKRDLPAVYG